MNQNLVMASLVTLSSLLISGMGLTGCRIGNRVIKAPDPTAMSGYYKTQPASMSVCAFIDGKPTQCVEAGINSIPSSIQNVMTDPVYVAANTSTARAYLVPNSLDTNSVFEMILDPTGKITASPLIDEPQPLWIDPACLSQVRIEKEGFIRAGAAQGSGSTSGSFKVSGTVDFTVGLLTVMGTGCVATFTQMRDCYRDADQCPGATPTDRFAEQQAIQGYLDPYLSRSTLTLDDLPSLRALGWEVSYQ